VRAYPLVERWQWLWIWTGDPALADPASIPDHDAIGLTDPEFDAVGGIYYAVPGRYMLMHDNLFDLTHLNVLHRSSIGAGISPKRRRFAHRQRIGSAVTASSRKWSARRSSQEFSPMRRRSDRSFGMKAVSSLFGMWAMTSFKRAALRLRSTRRAVGPDQSIPRHHAATTHTAHYFHAMSRNFGA